MVAGLLGACSTGERGSPDAPDIRNFQQEDAQLRQQYNASTILLQGRIIDSTGQPLVSATVSAGAATTTSDSDGRFALADLNRRNVLLTVEMPGFYSEQFPVILRLPADTDSVSLHAVALQA